MRGSFAGDPAFGVALFDLLERVFPGIGRGVEALRRLGAAWESVSTPYVVREGERIVAHVGLIELPIVLAGHPVAVGTLHAVATDPDHRGRGLFRRLMGEVLDDSADRYAALILTTEHPEYYTRFGFRHVPEHRFVARRGDSRSPEAGRSGAMAESWAAQSPHPPHPSQPLPPSPPSQPLPPFGRRLDLDDRADLERLHRLLATRQPVSNRVGVGPEKAVFLFNEGRRPLWWLEELDLVACAELDGSVLRLYDLVAPRLPSIEALWARVPAAVSEIHLHFAPDLIAPEAEAEAYVLDHDGPSYLMVRGRFAADGERFTLPRPART